VDEGTPSVTARRVAAHRLAFDRLEAPYGDPGADAALARDVAGPDPPEPTELMGPYLRGRTAFFDRVVVNALARGVTQVVSVGAGYDGRAWRYAKPGVRWWEVDHPATQADKRARLERLGVPCDHVAMVAHDLRHSGLAAGLSGAGFQPDAPALLVCEGVAVYLEAAVLESTLHELRSLATPGTRLAISLGTAPSSAEHAARRARFEAAVASWGEAARNSVTAAHAPELLASTRWQLVDVSERSRQAGFVMAAPIWRTAVEPEPVSRSRVGLFVERMLYRSGEDTLAGHLASTYGVPVKRVRPLDLGVHRVDRADGSRWVARLSPVCRPPEQVQADATVLDWLASSGFPAERCVDPRPVSVHEGQPVLVTAFAPGRMATSDPSTFEALGRLLGDLHLLPEGPQAAHRSGGAWHHLILDCGLAEELAAARSLLHDARHRAAPTDRAAYDDLVQDLAGLDDLEGLPRAFGHPDLVPRNLLRSASGELTLIDWTGAGTAPRVAALGCLLWAAAASPTSVRAAVAGYRSRITPSRDEVERIRAAMQTRPLVLACWSFATGRAPLLEMVAWWHRERKKIHRAAALAQDAFEPSAG
jgi:methyltransferase (TIGR00027 family)